MNRRQTNRSVLPAVEWWSALAAAAVAIPIGLVLLNIRGAALLRGSIAVLIVSVLLGPILAALGAWFDSRGGQSGGVLLLVLAALLTFDGMIATYFATTPLFVLVLTSLLAAILRRKAGPEAA